MKVVLDVGVPGVTIAMMATVRPEMEARHFQEVWRRTVRLHWNDFAKAMAAEVQKTSPFLE